jgi:hypothetical protein
VCLECVRVFIFYGANDSVLSLRSSQPPIFHMGLQGIQNCNIGMSFSDDDLALLFCKYDRNGEFNYLRFCRDMEAAERR